MSVKKSYILLFSAKVSAVTIWTMNFCNFFFTRYFFENFKFVSNKFFPIAAVLEFSFQANV